MKDGNLVQRRPAETAGVAGYVGLVIARAVGIEDADTILAIAGIVAFLPAAVTWIVTLARGTGGGGGRAG